ncbi:hypothetical protein HOY80DRAFT_860277, partial [Tuber brumale]
MSRPAIKVVRTRKTLPKSHLRILIKVRARQKNVITEALARERGGVQNGEDVGERGGKTAED